MNPWKVKLVEADQLMKMLGSWLVFPCEPKSKNTNQFSVWCFFLKIHARGSSDLQLLGIPRPHRVRHPVVILMAVTFFGSTSKHSITCLRTCQKLHFQWKITEMPLSQNVLYVWFSKTLFILDLRVWVLLIVLRKSKGLSNWRIRLVEMQGSFGVPRACCWQCLWWHTSRHLDALSKEPSQTL